MKAFQLFKRLWQYIILQGVDDPNSQQGKKILLLNQASFLTALGAFSLVLFCYFTQPNDVYVSITFAVGISYAAIIFIHRFKKPLWVQYYLVFINPHWVYFSILLTGSFFSQGVVALSTILLCYFFFYENKRLMKFGVVLHCLLYSISTSYVVVYQPIIIAEDLPFDEAAVFILTLCWIYIIFRIREEERTELINDLIIKNQQLEDRTEELKRFTYIASHDLKSPLRTIISFLGLMERDIKKGSMDNLSSNLEFVRSGAQQLNYLIQDVLELSKINEKKIKKTSEISLSTCLNKVMLNLKSELDEKECLVNAGQLPFMNGYEVEILLLFQNLIQNGIKYNDSKKPIINIWHEIKEKQLLIHFEDNGIGIEQAYHDKIFEMFKRLHNSDKYKGTGLGLSLCKKVAQSYGGDITVISNLGKGSVFTLSLPEHLIVTKESMAHS